MSLTYHAPTKQFTVPAARLERAALDFIHAIRCVREVAGLPLTKYKHSGPLSDADHAMRGIISGAKELGVDLGGEWGNEIDVSRES